MTGSAALALARLAQLDPGGRWANRPDRSLNQIFLPWRPQTTATPDERLAVIDMLRRRAAPQVAWPFLAGLLPTPHSISETSHQPRWREWHLDYQPPQMGVAEWSRHAEVITGWLLEVSFAVARERLRQLAEGVHCSAHRKMRTTTGPSVSSGSGFPGSRSWSGCRSASWPSVMAASTPQRGGRVGLTTPLRRDRADAG
jgi:hypothetical protein